MHSTNTINPTATSNSTTIKSCHPHKPEKPATTKNQPSKVKEQQPTSNRKQHCTDLHEINNQK